MPDDRAIVEQELDGLSHQVVAMRLHMDDLANVGWKLRWHWTRFLWAVPSMQS